MGASKAAATPAAAPMLTKLRVSRSSSRRRPSVYGVRHDASARTLLCAWSTSAATPAPSAPSAPPGRQPRGHRQRHSDDLDGEGVLARAPGTRTPLSSALTCGIPEPDARAKGGEQRRADAQTMEKPTNHGYAGVVSTERSAPKSPAPAAARAALVSAAGGPAWDPRRSAAPPSSSTAARPSSRRCRPRTPRRRPPRRQSRGGPPAPSTAARSDLDHAKTRDGPPPPLCESGSAPSRIRSSQKRRSTARARSLLLSARGAPAACAAGRNPWPPTSAAAASSSCTTAAHSPAPRRVRRPSRRGSSKTRPTRAPKAH